ncbi:hypothetical protein ABZ930_02890, partial [Streptomyces sp. NPDC046716]
MGAGRAVPRAPETSFARPGEAARSARLRGGLAFTVPAPKVAADHLDSVVGSWLTDRTYAKA